MIPEAQVLADALFRSSDGAEPDFVRAAALALELQRSARAVYSERMMEPIHRFRAEFSGKHLHRFICFLLPRLPHLDDWESFELYLASLFLGSNYFNRWTRTTPAATVELLFVRMVELWARNCPDLATLFEGPRTTISAVLGTRNTQYRASFLSAQTLSLMVVYLPSSVRDPRSSPFFSSTATTSTLARDLDILTKKSYQLLKARSTDIVLRGAINGLMKVPQVGMEIVVHYLLHPEKSAQDVRKYFQSLPDWSISWYSCAARPFEEENCLKSDGEMMACGKCQTVRYCSKDHQREHWKEHKKRCFPVEWDFS